MIPATSVQPPITPKYIGTLATIAEVIIITPKQQPPAAPIIDIATRLHLEMPSPTKTPKHKDAPTMTQSIIKG